MTSPVKRIDTLTERQWAAVYDERQKWLKLGMSTTRADRAAVEASMTILYAAKGHRRPVYIWADSPLSAVIMAGICRDQLGSQLGDQLRDQPWDQLRDQLWDQLGSQLGDQLRDQLWDQLWDQLGSQLWDQLGDQLRDQLWDQLGDQLRDQLWDQLGSQLGDQLWFQLGNQLWNQRLNAVLSGWDAAWLAFYRIPQILDLVTYPAEISDLLEQFATVTMNTSSWIPYEGFCFLSDRPVGISMVGEYRDARLHNPDGPAITFADGWAVYAWNGVRVPADLIAGKWTASDILREPNAEIRRCGIERMGWDRFVADALLVQVGPTTPDPGNPEQTLTLYDVPERVFNEPIRVLLCTNGTIERDGTRRRFGLTVPAHISDPLSAQAWIHTDDNHPVTCTPQQYARLARRC